MNAARLSNRSWGLFAAMVLLFVPLASASDEAVEASKESALVWLALIDSDQGEESWAEAGSLFKSRMDRGKWVDMLKQRSALGKVTSRELSSSKYSTHLPDAPEGEYVMLTYSTAFQNREGASENVALMLDEDGEFRVIGYFIP